MAPIVASGLLSVGSTLIEKLFTSKDSKEKAKLALLALQQKGELQEVEQKLSVLLAEANSTDKWTSRARPSFLYVVYIQILAAIPMGILTIFNPEAASLFTTGYKEWLSAIPEPILTMFGFVMTGYVAGRSWEKVKGVSK